MKNRSKDRQPRSSMTPQLKNMDQLILDDESMYEISKLYHAWFRRYSMHEEQK